MLSTDFRSSYVVQRAPFELEASAFERTITLGTWQKCQGWSVGSPRLAYFLTCLVHDSRTRHGRFPQASWSKAWDKFVPGSSGPICFGSRRSGLEKSWVRRFFFLVSHDLDAGELPTGHRSQGVAGQPRNAVPMIVGIRATSGETDSQID